MENKTEELIKLIDQAVSIAENILNNSGNSERLSNLINVLQSLRNQVLMGQLEPSGGNLTLGLAREVADWIEPLNSPLLTAVGAIEAYYQQYF
ncbi:hypothetical protein [Nostoc sp. TCL26-01]|uniref:hypothetical protein n=1 Tax=Nostoc sp. TCL26-01 TaxID=2576904 RepID=UPI0015B97D52|nr:hypothetical protein [Nostoc sp. TCL26-01]QLE56606.1 hypothetical protein FD725_14475 [Nostoc sp. TCL26-01]